MASDKPDDTAPPADAAPQNEAFEKALTEFEAALADLGPLGERHFLARLLGLPIPGEPGPTIH